jgi:glycosyltransferase involved in cell wall biosynthesis
VQQSVEISIIVSTYNQPDILELVIRSFQKQTLKNFELIIADDGSTDETRRLIENYKNKVDFPLHHTWHEDIGYRKTIIHNEAIRRSLGKLLIFIDGDCVVASDFVRDHFSIFEENTKHDYLFMGRRVEVGPKLTNEINKTNIDTILKPWSPTLFLSGLTKDTENTLRCFSIKNSLLRFILKADKVPDLLGSNFSIPKSLMVKINGFNEDLKFYWGEDADIFLRCRNLKVKIIGKKYFAVEYHLFHPRRAPKPDAEANYFEKLKDWTYVEAKTGLVHK